MFVQKIVLPMRYISSNFLFQCRNLNVSIKVEAPLKRRIHPRRAVMYVPGNDERKIKKIPTLDVDCVVLDCEDGVAINKKLEARKLIRQTLDNEEIKFGRSEATVRVNSVESNLCADDLDEILSAKNLPNALHLPKFESLDSLKWFLEKASSKLKDRSLKEKLDLILFIESAPALLSLVESVRGALKLCENRPFSLDALVFGSDDYCAGIGVTRTNDAAEIHFARQYIVTVAKAFNLQAIDIVFNDFKDTNGLINQSMQGASMGYTGKQVIHPVQVPICQEAFSPAPEKIKWATELITAFDEHQKSGKGAFVFKDCMIDMPLLRQAQNIVDLSNALKKATSKESDKNDFSAESKENEPKK